MTQVFETGMAMSPKCQDELMETAEDDAGYSVTMPAQDWVFINSWMDLASQRFGRRAFDDGFWDAHESRWGPLIDIAHSVRTEGVANVPRRPRVPEAATDVRLSAIQWSLVLAVLDTAIIEGDEDADVLARIADRIRTRLVDLGLIDLPILRIR